MTLKSGSKVTQGHRTDKNLSATCDFLLTLQHPWSYPFRDDDFSRKSPIFPPRVFNAPAEGGVKYTLIP